MEKNEINQVIAKNFAIYLHMATYLPFD